MMDANLLHKSEDFEQLPETWVIFITERDVIGKGLPHYPVERCFLGSGEAFNDGSYILYVNEGFYIYCPYWNVEFCGRNDGVL